MCNKLQSPYVLTRNISCPVLISVPLNLQLSVAGSISLCPPATTLTCCVNYQTLLLLLLLTSP